MKVLLLAALLLMGAVAVFSAAEVMASVPAGNQKDAGGHLLVEKWKEYEAATKADLPQTQERILNEIKELALERRYAWDLYDAATRLPSIVASRNWKLRDSALKAEALSIGKFDEPIVNFIYQEKQGASIASRLTYALENKDRLVIARNPEFYGIRTSSAAPWWSVAEKYVKNDWEYALWNISLRNSSETTRKARSLLSEGLSYPALALLESYALPKKDRQDYISRYDGRAAALLVRQEVLMDRFLDMKRQKDATSADYLSLRDSCLSFNKVRDSFKGEEADIAKCCKLSDQIISSLESKDLSAEIKDGKLRLFFTNVPHATVTISSGKKTVYRKKILNPYRSFHICDTAELRLPAINDGDYVLKAVYSDLKWETDYEKYTLSIASRTAKGSVCIYAADYITGEPVKAADVSVVSGTRTLSTHKNFRFDGFTPLSPKLQEALSDNSNTSVVCSLKDSKGIIRRSRPAYSYSRSYSVSEDLSANIMTDRGAFHPGETLKYKVVAYTTDYVDVLRPQPAGKKLTVSLEDPEGKTVASETLVTNEWGSIAGSFELTPGSRNGSWRLCVRAGKKLLSSRSVTVDDFVLPGFEIVFDADEDLHLPGDMMHVSGKVLSYSGHPMTSAKLSATVSDSRSSEQPEPFEVALGEDGAFSFDYKVPSEKIYWTRHVEVRLKVTDVTGETSEAFDSRMVFPNINPYISASGEIEGSFALPEGGSRYGHIFASDSVSIKAGVRHKDGMELSYEVLRHGELLYSCPAVAGEYSSVALPGPDGLYRLRLVAKVKSDDGGVYEDSSEMEILKFTEPGAALADRLENVFAVVPGDDIALRVGATAGKVWGVAELFDSDHSLLASRTFILSGTPGDEASSQLLSFPYEQSYGDYVALQIFYFRNGTFYTYSHDWRRPVESKSLPLRFSRFVDKAVPGEKYSFLVETDPEVEVTAAIFDKSTEAIRSNIWSQVRIGWGRSASVSYSAEPGLDGTHRSHYPLLRNGGMKIRGASAQAVMKSAADRDMLVEEVTAVSDVAPEAASMGEGVPEGVDDSAVSVREDFATTLAFEPFLHSDRFGLATLDFETSDKLSTFVVQLFAHDKTMRNTTLRREMVVTVPVRISVVEPQTLFEGDKWVVKGALSSLCENDVPGTVVARVYTSSDWKNSEPVLTRSTRIVSRAGAQDAFECEIDVPSTDVLGLRLSFVPDEGILGADALFVSVPVRPAVQTLSEAHSAIVPGGADIDAVIASLRSEFVNTSGADAVLRRISVLDMVREALPDVVDARGKDVLSVTSALYAGLLSRSIDPSVSVPVSSLEGKAAACRNDDGGFGWFEGMGSSPVLTAIVLTRLREMERRGLSASVPVLESFVTDAVKYLDRNFFADSATPYYRGGISLEQYLYVRSLYPMVPFGATGVSAKRWKEFRKASDSYFLPKKERGLRGAVLSKSRRALTLLNLTSDASGAFSDVPVAAPLLKAWGISLGKTDDLRSSFAADIRSLVEYAVSHPHGGVYYPNAVMPWRGLMESEIDAHVTLCSLMDRTSALGLADAGKCARIAEGIRFWMMIQKETQKWNSEPAFIEALAAVLSGSEETLGTQVVSLSKTYTKPLGKIKAFGNGFRISRVYMRDGKPLKDGDILNVGERVTAQYRIWNGENRSFVVLSAPRPASLRPADQLSGVSGWWSWTRGYRNVLKDRTEWWYDSFPEENSTVTEDFYVTQKGVFSAPAVTVESLYAPHYRANGTAAVLRSE